jgi:hypothetical protein
MKPPQPFETSETKDLETKRLIPQHWPWDSALSHNTKLQTQRLIPEHWPWGTASYPRTLTLRHSVLSQNTDFEAQRLIAEHWPWGTASYRRTLTLRHSVLSQNTDLEAQRLIPEQHSRFSSLFVSAQRAIHLLPMMKSTLPLNSNQLPTYPVDTRSLSQYQTALAPIPRTSNCVYSTTIW